MESQRDPGVSRVIEENTLAILDASGEKDSKHIKDDRLAFLEAVRACSLVPENAAPPTNKMYRAIFQILRDEDSLELIMESYHLLCELAMLFPQVHFFYVDGANTSSSPKPDVVVAKEQMWLPFSFGLDVCTAKGAAARDCSGAIDCSGFNLLVEKLADVENETNFPQLETKFLANMLLFQYLVTILEGDFLPRYRAYNETMNWTILRESSLNTLLGSRRINYKGLIKDCLSILCCFHGQCQDSSSRKPPENSSNHLEIAFLEARNVTQNAVQKLMVMILELDISKKTADLQGHTTRVDGVRTPLMEIVLDELTYNKDMLPLFLEGFTESKWKQEIILQYFSKYLAKPSVRTRRSSGDTEDSILVRILKYFSTTTGTKSIIKKIGSRLAQLLLAHAFQAYLSLASQPCSAKISWGFKNDVGDGASLVIVCKKIISAFSHLKETDGRVEILPLGKEALFMASTILSVNS